mgnify:CR=1 FL=1
METKEAKKYVRVGQKTLELYTILKRALYKEDKNNIILKTTTLDNYPIDAKGEIRIYELSKKNYLKNVGGFK